uniref:Uncharacterized protein n=1 Tax=Arundo donax TaxID=35708 RepID=A0A0A9A252_ARUDO
MWNESWNLFTAIKERIKMVNSEA